MTDTALEAVYLAAADLNGTARGKRLPAAHLETVRTSGARFPKSVLNLDILGHDIKNSPLVLASGDQDGLLQETERGLVPMPWLETPSAMLPVWMFEDDGRPFAGDPRHALADIEKRFTAKGLQPVVALELEFCLYAPDLAGFSAPKDPGTKAVRAAGDILSIAALTRHEAFFSDLYSACALMDIPADTAISESGLGQYELNLIHQPSALKAADDAWLFKQLVKGMARKHGMGATFMAKPHPDWSGSGLHMHFSVADETGQNIFDDRRSGGAATLEHAIAGCLAALHDCTLVFAPLGNSYDRLVPGAHAPTGVAWAHENRTVALRVPAGPPAARRIEHRLAGGDANPYLVIAAVLGAALDGIEAGKAPPAPITGNAYAQSLPQVPASWQAALDAFETSAAAARIFPGMLIRNMLMTKRQEQAVLAELAAPAQQALYLDTF